MCTLAILFAFLREAFRQSVSVNTAVGCWSGAVELRAETDGTLREESFIEFRFGVAVSTGRVLSFLSQPKSHSGALLSNLSPAFL